MIRSFSFCSAVSWAFLIASTMLAFSGSVKVDRLVTLIFLSGFKLAFLTAKSPCASLNVFPTDSFPAISVAVIERVAVLLVLYRSSSLTVPSVTRLAGFVVEASVIESILDASAFPKVSSKTFPFETSVALSCPCLTVVLFI